MWKRQSRSKTRDEAAYNVKLLSAENGHQGHAGLARRGSVSQPDYSPDGAWILFRSDEPVFLRDGRAFSFSKEGLVELAGTLPGR
jgi:hypothetical protein